MITILSQDKRLIVEVEVFEVEKISGYEKVPRHEETKMVEKYEIYGVTPRDKRVVLGVYNTKEEASTVMEHLLDAIPRVDIFSMPSVEYLGLLGGEEE